MGRTGFLLGTMKHAPALLAIFGIFVYSSGSAQEPIPSPAPPAIPTRGKAEHVVVVVWDGMRPDLIREDTTPTLARMAHEGTFFARHHSIYPTSTEVNGTAIATGCFPAHSGIIGNREYRPAIEPREPVATEAAATVRKGDEITGGKYLAVPTLPEVLQQSGRRTVIAGTKGVALLMDRSLRQAQADAAARSTRLVGGKSLPVNVAEEIVKAQGEFPSQEGRQLLSHLPNTLADAWTTQALTASLWHGEPPGFSVLWLSEPDFSQHEFGVGSPTGLRALGSSDAQLATVLATLEKGGWRDKTDVLVVSDHGFSTIGDTVDLHRELIAAGLPAHRSYNAPPKCGDILVNSLGGSVYLYVAEHDEAMIDRVVGLLQGSDYAGTIFTRQGTPGTFPLEAAHIDSPDAPDVVVALRWTEDKNAAGLPGTTYSHGERKAGQGTHATFSRYDVHNTLVAAGPDFRAGAVSELPSSNADVAPTVAWILGQPLTSPVDGRILGEAVEGFPVAADAVAPTTKRLEASHDLAEKHWQQYLQVTRYAGETYLDEANGSSSPLARPVPPQ